MQFYVDIQRNIFEANEDDEPRNDLLELLVGTKLSVANMIFDHLTSYNLNTKGVVYIRLRLFTERDNVILSRRTPSGVGDW